MSPSTDTPAQAMKIQGVWTCHTCAPAKTGKGGQREFYQHWLLRHGDRR